MKTTITRLTILLTALLTISTHAFAQCPTAPGNQTTSGTNAWIGYVYSGLDTANPPTNVFTSTYRGYITQPAQFDQNLGTAALSGANVCGTYNDKFSIRYKMTKDMPAGNYTFVIGGDDGVRFSVDGGATWIVNDWTNHLYNTTTEIISLSGTTNFVLEYYEQVGTSRVSIAYGICDTASTAPTSIAGTTALCVGSSTTLTATGGTLGSNGIYQWGTGTVGNNIIASQTTDVITVSPTVNTTYWVRRIDAAPCALTTAGTSQLVTVAPLCTNPTGFTGASTICKGSSATLTAIGGVANAGSTYEWGTGSVIGSNIIAGQTTSTITLSPMSTQTYWVRRVNGGACTGTTSGITFDVTVTVPDGDEVTYGTDSWIGYTYATIDLGSAPTNTFTTNYRGYLTQPEMFDMNLAAAPLNGPNICGSYPTRFAIRFKMQKNFAAGYYTFIVGGDDGYRLSLDGGATFIVNNWQDHSYTTSTTAPIYISGSKNLVLEYYEQGGVSRVSFQYLGCQTYSTAPTTISGDLNVCRSAPGTLTVSGGTAAAGSTYQWGTGTTVGNNVIAGQTGATLSFTIAANTTFWVRRYDPNPCNIYSAGITQLVTVTNPSTAPTSLGSTTTICPGATFNLTASGGTAAAGSQYEFGTGSVIGANSIAVQTSNVLAVTFTETIQYWVRRIDAAPCSTTTNGVVVTFTAATPSSAPTSISGPATYCANTGGFTLAADGGTLGSSANYQWGTGSVIGSAIITGTNQSIYVSPTTTTTYWVRIRDLAPCNNFTTGVTFTVNVTTRSSAPTSINNASTACAGPVTLTAIGGTVGSGSSYSWGTGYTVGQNVIDGENGVSISVNPTEQTVYWVNRIDGAPCSSSTQGPTILVSVRSTPPTEITGINSLCAGSGGTTLTVNGGTAATNGVFQWGTGSVVGSNAISGNTSNTLYVNPAATTTYWVRRYDPAPCNSYTTGVTFTVNVSNQSTSPTAISGNTTICAGTSTTLTATGGTLSPGSIYNWGTGYSVGANIIAGETGVSITVNPSVQTVYWVRRVDGAPCNFSTQGPTVVVNVTAASTPPTSISGNPTASVCAGSSVTLTANGGTSASGAVFQWGTGTVGSNIIVGQTSASITVSPTTSTTYWVRRKDGAPCNTFTSAATTTISIATAPGNPAAFGTDQWFTYGFSGNDVTLATDTYLGYYITNNLGLDTTVGTNNWAITASPSAAAGWIGCPVPVDYFTMVHKRQGFPCGTYTVKTENWDDKAELYIDGVKVWSCATWFGGGSCAGYTGTHNLTATSTIEFRISENAGVSQAKITLTQTNINATSPTTLAGNSPICGGVSTLLTASGGTNGTNGVFQWGTGSVLGANIIGGQTAATYTVSPTVTTTFWVRRIDSVCGNTTSGVFKTIIVQPGVIAGTLSTTSTEICKNTRPNDIVLTGNSGTVLKWQSSDDVNFTINVADIASTATTLTSAQIGILSATKYFRAVVQGTCDIKNTAPLSFTIGATAIYSAGNWSTPPTSISTILVKSNLTLPETLKVCSCQISNNAVLTIPENISLVVENDVIVDAGSNMIVKSSGSLVQINDNAINQGTITVKRNTTPMKLYDYNYWSSPVEGVTLNQLSPNTLLDKYFKFNPITNSWNTITSGLETMVPSKGYIVRAPQGWSQTNATNGVYEGVFNGKPNSGVINVQIQKGLGANNLIGNPYPSAIDIDVFLTDPINQGVVNGTVYLWTHNTAISSQIAGPNTYNYTSDDYAKYNLTGGIKTSATAITGGVAPTGKIASGQSFFIETKPGLAAGDYTARFSNKMRVADMNNQYFRPISDQGIDYNPREKNRLWLNITSSGGAYNETLLGYIANATNGYDNLYDGKLFGTGNVLSIYSMLDESTPLCIQGRALPFDNNEIIPLGYRSNFAGNITIGIEDMDGFFTNQSVYLLDKTTNVCTNLKTGSYTFFSASGTFNTRFELRYKQPVGQKFAPIKEALIAAVAADEQKISVVSNAQIVEVQVFDILGKLLLKADGINAKEFETQLNVPNQVLIVKTKLSDGNYYTQKIVLQ